MKKYTVREKASYPDPEFPFRIWRTQTETGRHHFHGDDSVEICYIYTGDGRYCIDRTFYPVETGRVLLIPRKTLHEIIANKVDRAVLMFPFRLLSRLPYLHPAMYTRLFTRRGLQHRSLLLKADNRNDVEMIIARMLDELRNKREGYKAALLAYLTEFLILLHRLLSANQLPLKPSTQAEQIVLVICRFIEENLRGELSLPKIAKKAGLNATYFSTLFKQVAGMPLTVYINRKRVARVRQILETTEMKVSAAAYEAGFRDVAHFHRVFKKYVHTSPLRYLKSCERYLK